MHFDDFTKKGIEQSKQTQRCFACDTQLWFLGDRRENEFGKTTRRDHTGAGNVPRSPIGVFSFGKSKQRFRKIRNKDELMRSIDRPNDICAASLQSRVEDSAYV